MRVTLLHNPKAGFGECGTGELARALAAKGWEVVIHDTKQETLAEHLRDPGELVVIAGGDGTVGTVGKMLAGRSIPIGLLPLGTANNIATTLGLSGHPREIIAGWDMEHRQAFDVGVIKGLGNENLFLESCGFGVFPRLIRRREKKDSKESREAELADALKHQHRILGGYEPHACTIRMDGEVLEGEMLMVEIMNTGLVGPNMLLSPSAEVGDGMLDVVVVREEERWRLSDFLDRCLEDEATALGPWHRHRARSIGIEWHGRHFHLDDEAREEGEPIRLEVSLRPGALEFLLPA